MRISRPSPAMVIAIAALFLSLTGSAVAAKKYVLSSTKQVSPSVLKALKGNAGAKGAQGAQGAQGPAGAQGPQGAQGGQGPAGAAGSALGYGYVSPAGGLEDTKGSYTVTKNGTGTYCVSTSATVNNISATLGNDGDAVSLSADTGTTNGCPSNTKFFVFTYDIAISGGTTTFNGKNSGFYFTIN